MPAETKEVTVYEFSPIGEIEDGRLAFRLSCSSGTYARGLAHDLGVALGTGAHLAALRRTRIGSFTVESALRLPDLEQAMSQGRDPQALDKEFLRRWLVEKGWKGEGAPPVVPDEVRCEAARRYIEAFERITARDFVPDLEPPIERIRRNLGI